MGWPLLDAPGNAPRRRADSGLTGVSCTAATGCFAVGAAGDGPRTLIERWTRHKWRIQASGSGRAGFLTAIACSSPAACTAVGSTSSGRALAEHWNGTRWAIQHVPSPRASWLTGVSCPSPTDCSAVGNATPGGGEPFAEHWSKGSWKPQRIPEPSGFFFLNAVSCSSPDACTAIGYHETTSTFPVTTVADRWNGHTWTPQTTSNLPGINSELNGVSCPSSSDCTATGYHETAPGQRVLAEHWNGKHWASQPAPNPKDRAPQLTAVSCPSPDDCTATGSYFKPDRDGGQFLTLAEQHQT